MADTRIFEGAGGHAGGRYRMRHADMPGFLLPSTGNELGLRSAFSGSARACGLEVDFKRSYPRKRQPRGPNKLQREKKRFAGGLPMRTKAMTGTCSGGRPGPAGFPAMCRALGGIVLLFMLGAGLAATGVDARAETLAEMTRAMNKALADAGKELGLAPNSGNVQIFKDYTYGMSRQEVRQRAGALPCDDPDLKEALCAKKPVSFAGTTWEQVFTFDASGLDQVLLAKENIGPEELFGVFEVLGAENSIVSMNNGFMTFDLIEEARVLGFEEAQNMGRQYLMASLQNGSTFEACLFPDTYIRKLLREKSPGAFASLKDAPGNLRVIQLILSEEDEVAALIFSTPVQFIKRLKKKHLRERF